MTKEEKLQICIDYLMKQYRLRNDYLVSMREAVDNLLRCEEAKTILDMIGVEVE